jgi:hypothetical protein
MRLFILSFSCAALLGCGAIEDLLGEEDEDPPPVEPVQPEPVNPEPNDDDRDDGTAQNDDGDGDGDTAGGFPFPGLDGLRLPLPVPDEGSDPEPPARGSLGPPPPESHDAAGHLLRPFLEAEAERVHQALVAALPAHEQGQTREIPFEVIAEDREPNAAAGCTRSTRSPLMMITTAMLTLAAGTAEAKAYDELAGTTTFDQYVTAVIADVRNQRSVQPISPSLHTGPTATDPHKLGRQVHLYQQQVAFIVGHELAHHYRGHTNCVAGRTDEEQRRDEAAQILAHTVPPFSQPREIEADMWGVTNVLEAGRTRPAGQWTQEGALLNLDFFRQLADEGGPQIVLAFLSTHPPSLVRIPIVRSTSQQWEPGRRPPTMPVPGGNMQLPGGIELPRNLPFPIPFPGGGGN